MDMFILSSGLLSKKDPNRNCYLKPPQPVIWFPSDPVLSTTISNLVGVIFRRLSHFVIGSFLHLAWPSQPHPTIPSSVITSLHSSPHLPPPSHHSTSAPVVHPQTSFPFDTSTTRPKMSTNIPNSQDPVVNDLEQMHHAFVLAGRKVHKCPKAETPAETFHRVRETEEQKIIKRAKSAAKRSVKKKITKKMTSYFPLKWN